MGTANQDAEAFFATAATKFSEVVKRPMSPTSPEYLMAMGLEALARGLGELSVAVGAMSKLAEEPGRTD